MGGGKDPVGFPVVAVSEKIAVLTSQLRNLSFIGRTNLKYYTGEEVKLLDKVECLQGGEWISATVVYVDQPQDATSQFACMIEEVPGWAEDTIGIICDDCESVKRSFFENAVNIVNVSIFFVGTAENDELRFIRRNR